MWDPRSGSFDGPRLRLAIVSRGWTIPDFASAAGVHMATVYSAVNGNRVRDGVAIRIFGALERRKPGELFIPVPATLGAAGN